MGWPTSGDIYAADQLKFTSKENAISFCKRYSISLPFLLEFVDYPFEVEEPTEPSPYLFKVFGDRVLKRTVVAEMKEVFDFHIVGDDFVERSLQCSFNVEVRETLWGQVAQQKAQWLRRQEVERCR